MSERTQFCGNCQFSRPITTEESLDLNLDPGLTVFCGAITAAVTKSSWCTKYVRQNSLLKDSLADIIIDTFDSPEEMEAFINARIAECKNDLAAIPPSDRASTKRIEATLDTYRDLYRSLLQVTTGKLAQ